MRQYTPLLAWLSMVCLLFAGNAQVAAFTTSDPRPQQSGLKIEVSQNGIFRLTGADLLTAGVDPASIDPASLRMFHRDSEIAVRVVSNEGGFDKDAAILFYAEGVDNPYTGTDVYWLYWGGSTSGMRMQWVDGAVEEALPQVAAFTDVLTIEENHIPWLETPGAPNADYWFWEKITAPEGVTYYVEVVSPVSDQGTAVFTVWFQGRDDAFSTASHHTVVWLNGQAIGEETWAGDMAHAQVMTISQGLLNDGLNIVTVESESDGLSADVIYFNRITVEYRRRLEAVDDRLTFFMNASDTVCATVSGFSDSNIHLYDITDLDEVKIVSGADIQPDAAGFSACFKAQAAEKTYLAVVDDAVGSPDRLTFRPLSDLKDTSNGADYILVTSNEFTPAVEKLCELRALQGMRVKIADIEAIYDLFSYGLFDPSALCDFLKYAYDHWEAPAPKYVLLAGNANLDYRDYYGTGKKNIIPVYLSMTEGLGLTPSDNRYACVEGEDPVPDICIGRVPGGTPDMITAIVNKLILYESTRAQASESALFVADDDDPAFEALNDDLAAYLPSWFFAEKVYTRAYSNLIDATDDILGFVDGGMLLTSFMGHGDVTRWGAEPFGGGDFIIEPDDVNFLSNDDRLTFIIALDCLNGYFSQPFHYCLAEEWVMAAEKGAVACFAPSGLSHPQEHAFLSYFVFSKIFLDGENRLGDIATGSKIDAYASGASEQVLVSFNLIGDPATRLALNRESADLVTLHTITAEAGSGGTIVPAGDVLVFDGSDQTFAAVPDAGYRVSDILVDGISRGAGSEFTFNNLTEDHSIRAVFRSGDQSGMMAAFLAAVAAVLADALSSP